MGLGADGLSSSAYGPEEAFKALGAHTHLGLYMALATAATVFIISLAYNQVIELFPTGGGGYRVATSLIGPRAGLVSGAALIVDYVLTIAISVASGVDALFSLLPASFGAFKLGTELALTVPATSPMPFAPARVSPSRSGTGAAVMRTLSVGERVSTTR